MYRSLTILGVGALLGLSACSGSGTSPKTLPSQNLASNVLQFSIGTANLYGDLGAGGYVGINVATTRPMRSASSHSDGRSQSSPAVAQ